MIKRKSTLQKISEKSGRKVTECKCQSCKNLCTNSICIGTPDDIEKIIDAGRWDGIAKIEWATGQRTLKVIDHSIFMYQPYYVAEKKSCYFFENGLCKLHASGLKPTEGKLANHEIREDNFNPNLSLAFLVAQEWEKPENRETINRIKNKLYQ